MQKLRGLLGIFSANSDTQTTRLSAEKFRVVGGGGGGLPQIKYFPNCGNEAVLLHFWSLLRPVSR